jgi:single-stranded-DNA-specific exonuclease
MHDALEEQRGLRYRWRARSDDGPIGDGTLTERVLRSRGVHGDAADGFLSPSLAHLHEPSLIPGIDRAAARLLEAASSGASIVIYGDYDVDGITATAIVYRMLRAIEPAARLSTYVPHRIDEGYGLSAAAIGTLAEGGADVIVSVDCGITAVEPALVARSLGVDLIITDHHNPPSGGNTLPDAYAIVHPALPGSQAPFRDLCGAGVAYKLAWRLATLATGASRVRDDLRQLLIDLLGLVALGTIADVVPLVGENRVLTRFGLGRIRSSPFVGLRALVSASRLGEESIDTERVGFLLAPQINACGRMGHAREAIELMLTDDAERAGRLAIELAAFNEQRKRTERAMVEQAVELAVAAGMTGPDRRAIVLAHEDWHPGVVGIVCSRLVDRFARPVLLLQRQAERSVGSGRSIDGFNLHGALEACAAHLEGFGGHDMAAGLRVRHEQFEAFAQAFVDHAGAMLQPADLVRSIEYDLTTSLAELTHEEVARLALLAPFGRSNPAVRVRACGLRLNGAPKTMGRFGKHLSLDLASGESGRGVRAVAWGWAEHAADLASGMRVDAVFTPKISTWAGRSSVEAELIDLRVVG